MESVADQRDLLKEEVAMCNYLLKSTNLKSPKRNEIHHDKTEEAQASQYEQ